jgi:hypothetical protein
VALIVVALVAVVALAACQEAQVGAWERLGSTNGSVMLTMAPDPFVTRQLYVGTSDGRVIRVRVDSRGTASTALPQADTAVAALAPDPAHAGVLFAATNRGLYVSTDYAETWRVRGSGLPRDDPPEALVFGAVAGGVAPLYAGTQQHGAYASRDGGTTWAPLSAGLPPSANIYSLTFDAATGTLLAALTSGDGIYALPAGSQTWAARSAGLPAGADVFTVLPVTGVAGAGGATFYAGTSAGLYASADRGATWRPSGLPGARVLALAADAGAPGTLYASTDSTVYRSTDGMTWSALAPGIAAHVPALAVLPDAQRHPVVFAGTDSILRYPALPGGQDDLGNVFGLVVLLALGGALFWVYRRSLRQLRESATRHAPVRAPPPEGERLP